MSWCLDPEQVTTILAAATGTGAGNTYAVPQRRGGGLPANISWSTAFTGTPGSVSITLEASLDGTVWTTLDTTTSTAGELRTLTGKMAAFLRANVGTLSGGSSPTATVLVALGG